MQASAEIDPFVQREESIRRSLPPVTLGPVTLKAPNRSWANSWNQR